MELEITSKIGKSDCQSETIYRFLSNFDNIKKLLPAEHSDKFESFGESCMITVNSFVKIGLEIIEKEQNKMIKIGTSEGGESIYIWFQLKEAGPYDTRIRITIRTKTNLMAKLMMKKKLQDFADNFVDGLCAIPPQILMQLAGKN